MRHLTAKNKDNFFSRLKVGDKFTSSPDDFIGKDVHRLAKQQGVLVRYFRPGTLEYKEFGCFTYQVTSYLCSLQKLKGLTVDCVRGIRTDQRIKSGFSPQYILFTDEKTYMALEEQDYYTYHDCNFNARCLRIEEDERMWKIIKEDLKRYPEADID